MPTIQAASVSLSAGSAFSCTPVHNQLTHLQYNTKVKHHYSHKNGTNNGFCFYIHNIKFGFLLPFWGGFTWLFKYFLQDSR